jgi:hypothetical protein
MCCQINILSRFSLLSKIFNFTLQAEILQKYLDAKFLVLAPRTILPKRLQHYFMRNFKVTKMKLA